jgi:hypothetical protein
MTQDGTVNARIVDSVAVNATLLTGQSPSQAFGMLDTVMAETLGMAMHNAVMRQQAGSMVSSAAVTAACAKMLQAPITISVSPPPPPPPPPHVDKLDPPPPSPQPPSVTIATAVADGEAAIDTLKVEAESTSGDAAKAQAGLAQLAQAAAPPPSPPAPPAPPSPPAPPAPPTGGGSGEA